MVAPGGFEPPPPP